MNSAEEKVKSATTVHPRGRPASLQGAVVWRGQVRTAWRRKRRRSCPARRVESVGGAPRRHGDLGARNSGGWREPAARGGALCFQQRREVDDRDRDGFVISKNSRGLTEK